TQPAQRLEVPECKRQNTPPILPPKPDPALLKRHLVSMENLEHILQYKPAMLPAQDMNKIGPLESPSRMHYHVGKRECPQLQVSASAQESSLEQPEKQGPISINLALQCSSLPLNSITLNTHAPSLKQGHYQGVRAHLLSHCPRALSSHPGEIILSPSAMSGHASSLSYDSLLGLAKLAQDEVLQLGYLPPFFPLESGLGSPTDPLRLRPHTCRQVQSHLCRESLPVIHHDILSTPLMSSTQEHGKLEDHQKQLLVLQVQPSPSLQNATIVPPGIAYYSSRMSCHLTGPSHLPMDPRTAS
ncbi:hypothetical protein P4O66_005978, partial [Electrophorus voltai]